MHDVVVGMSPILNLSQLTRAYHSALMSPFVHSPGLR